MRGRLTPPTLEGVLMVGFLTVALIGAVVGLSIWLTNKSDSAEAAAETQPAETQPAETAPTETEPATTAETEPAETEGETEEAETEAETEEAETEAETEGGAAGEGDPAAGEAVWNSAGCASCHTLAAAGSTGTVGPNLDDAQPSHELVVERVTNGAGPMPAFGQQGILTEQQIQDVAAYVFQSTSG